MVGWDCGLDATSGLGSLGGLRWHTSRGGDAQRLLNFGAAGWAGNIVSTTGVPSRWCWCSALELQLVPEEQVGQLAAEGDTMWNGLR